MSNQLPAATIDVLRTINDIIIGQVGISCTLYIPTNLTAVEPLDMYVTPSDLTFTEYLNQTVHIEFFVSDRYRLRKLGIFTENELPILARFKNVPEITLSSYIKVPIRYLPNSIDVDELEVVDILMSSVYDAEIYRWFKMSPRRVKV